MELWGRGGRPQRSSALLIASLPAGHLSVAVDLGHWLRQCLSGGLYCKVILFLLFYILSSLEGGFSAKPTPKKWGFVLLFLEVKELHKLFGFIFYTRKLFLLPLLIVFK